MRLTDHVRGELKRLHEKRRFSQVKVARTLNVDPSTISHAIHRENQPLTLDLVEAIAEAARIPVAELIAPPGSAIKQLNADEASVVRYLRLWPASVVKSLVGFLAFFADEPSVDPKARNFHEYWRRMPAEERDFFYGCAQWMREGRLGRDIRQALAHQLGVEEPRTEADDAKRRRKP